MSVNLRMIPSIPLSFDEVIEFLITCMEIVDAPPASEFPNNCPTLAFKKRGASNPLCSKNLESSVATRASINT